MGDEVTVGNRRGASETYKFTVRGIYGKHRRGAGRIRFSDAEIREDNREERRLYVVHQLRAKRSGCGPAQECRAIPNLQHHLHADRSGHIQQVRATGDKGQSWTSKFTISSPSLDAHYKAHPHRWTPPPKPNARRCWRTVVGGLAFAGIGAVGAIGGRRDEIGMAMVSGVTKGTFGMAIHAGNVHDDRSRLGNRIDCRRAAGQPLAPHGPVDGAVAITSSSVWNMIWWTGRLPGSGHHRVHARGILRFGSAVRRPF